MLALTALIKSMLTGPKQSTVVELYTENKLNWIVKYILLTKTNVDRRSLGWGLLSIISSDVNSFLHQKQLCLLPL